MPDISITVITRVMPSCTTWPEFAQWVSANLNWRELYSVYHYIPGGFSGSKKTFHKYHESVHFSELVAVLKHSGFGDGAKALADALVEMGFFKNVYREGAGEDSGRCSDIIVKVGSEVEILHP